VADERSVATDDESGEDGAEEDDQEDVPDRDQVRILAHSRGLSLILLLSIFPLLYLRFFPCDFSPARFFP
jgi:hypothetical protein